MDVKTVIYPRPLAEKDVRLVVELQRKSLKEGPAMLALVPTLLQLSQLVGRPARVFSGYQYPYVGHPLGEALAICELYDPDIVVKQRHKGPEVKEEKR